MKLWVDDVRPAPKGYRTVRSVNEAKEVIEAYESCDECLVKKYITLLN